MGGTRERFWPLNKPFKRFKRSSKIHKCTTSMFKTPSNILKHRSNILTSICRFGSLWKQNHFHSFSVWTFFVFSTWHLLPEKNTYLSISIYLPQIENSLEHNTTCWYALQEGLWRYVLYDTIIIFTMDFIYQKFRQNQEFKISRRLDKNTTTRRPMLP